MAHFAEIDANNIVLRVVVVNNDVLLDSMGQEQELKGIAFCKNLFGGNWVQTSYSKNFRKNFAGIGFLYSKQLDAFIPPKPFNSWILDENSCQWMAPVSKPLDDSLYIWNEDIQNWQKLE